MPKKNENRALTAVLVLLGTAIVSFLPLYITRFHAAIEDGGLLLIGSVFAADALLRCLSPLNKRTNWNLLFGLGALAVVLLTASEYTPIAAKLLKQNYALQVYVEKNDTAPLRRLHADALAQKTVPAEQTIPNDSLILLFASLLADMGVIFVIEKK
jgi:hypothetical protein